LQLLLEGILSWEVGKKVKVYPTNIRGIYTDVVATLEQNNITLSNSLLMAETKHIRYVDFVLPRERNTYNNP
jgi:hypothetical protein